MTSYTTIYDIDDDGRLLEKYREDDALPAERYNRQNFVYNQRNQLTAITNTVHSLGTADPAKAFGYSADGEMVTLSEDPGLATSYLAWHAGKIAYEKNDTNFALYRWGPTGLVEFQPVDVEKRAYPAMDVAGGLRKLVAATGANEFFTAAQSGQREAAFFSSMGIGNTVPSINRVQGNGLHNQVRIATNQDHNETCVGEDGRAVQPQPWALCQTAPGELARQAALGGAEGGASGAGASGTSPPPTGTGGGQGTGTPANPTGDGSAPTAGGGGGCTVTGVHVSTTTFKPLTEGDDTGFTADVLITVTGSNLPRCTFTQDVKFKRQQFEKASGTEIDRARVLRGLERVRDDPSLPDYYTSMKDSVWVLDFPRANANPRWRPVPADGIVHDAHKATGSATSEVRMIETRMLWFRVKNEAGKLVWNRIFGYFYEVSGRTLKFRPLPDVDKTTLVDSEGLPFRYGQEAEAQQKGLPGFPGL